MVEKVTLLKTRDEGFAVSGALLYKTHPVTAVETVPAQFIGGRDASTLL